MVPSARRPSSSTGIEIDSHGLRARLPMGAGTSVAFCEMSASTRHLSGRPRRDDELSAHAREFVARHAAQIGEIAGARGAEGDIVLAPLPAMRADGVASGRGTRCRVRRLRRWSG